MKTNVTYIDACKFEALILVAACDLGFSVTPQKGFVKVAGPRGRTLYVASTKRVGRVDLSGFTVPAEGGHVQTPHCGEFGNVKQQLRFDRPEPEVLEAFALLLTHMAALTPAEKTERKSPAQKADEPVGWTAIKKGARKERIAKAAEAHTTA
jgi:hypothetical protein